MEKEKAWCVCSHLALESRRPSVRWLRRHVDDSSAAAAAAAGAWRRLTAVMPGTPPPPSRRPRHTGRRATSPHQRRPRTAPSTNAYEYDRVVSDVQFQLQVSAVANWPARQNRAADTA